MGRSFYRFYVALVAASATAVISLPRSAALHGSFGELPTIAALPAAAMAVCLLASISLLVAAWRAALAELALVGAALSALASLSLLQTLATPGFIRTGPGLAFSAGAAALPAAALLLAPMLVGASTLGRVLGRHWKGWSVLTLVTLAAGGAAAWLSPPAWLPAGGTVGAGVLGAFGAIGATAVAARLLRLHGAGGDRRFVVVATSVAGIAAIRIASGYSSVGSASWWAVWALELIGFAAVTAAGISLTRNGAVVTAVLRVALNHDPLSTLEVCASREVAEFVEALSSREPYTHDHALRVGELAARVAERAGLPARRIRDAGIAGVLHDIASVMPATSSPPVAALGPARKTSGPGTRAESSAAILRGSPVLAGVADIVRYQHERFDAAVADGTGPAVRPCTSSPFEAFLVAACDAWDAMVHDRSYRNGIGAEQARRALLDGAGSRWHPEAVRLVLAEVAATQPIPTSAATWTLGANPPSHAGYLGAETPVHFGSVCPDALAQAWDTPAGHTRKSTGPSKDPFDDSYDDGLNPRLDQLSELLRSQKRFRTAFEQAPIGMLIVDPAGKIHSCNSAFETLLGFEDPAAGTTAIDLVSSADRRSALRWVASLRRRPDYVYSCDLRLEHRGSGAIPVHVAGSVIEEEDSSLFYLIHVVDLSERQRMELELRRQAFIDPLTGLLNRRGLLAAGPELIRRNQIQGQTTTGVFIDLDGLKAINDTLGHESGDQAIVDVATVIASAFPAGSLFARLGGDEMFVLTSLATPDPDALSAALRARLAEHAVTRGRPYKLSASAGTSAHRGDSDSIANLIDRSDQDLYARRRVERNPANRRNSGSSHSRPPLREPAMSGHDASR
ncbi:MAG: diguanylate cyclase [Acidimicrobiales bacterium]